jgi:hypothetical protein
MLKQFKSKDFNGAIFVVFPVEDKAKEFVSNSKETPIKYDETSTLECSLQDDHHKKKALESATGGKPANENGKDQRNNDKQARKDKRKEDLERKTSEHMEKLKTENLLGALIHLTGQSSSILILCTELDVLRLFFRHDG